MTEQFSVQVCRALDDLGVDEETRHYRIDKYGEYNFVDSLDTNALSFHKISGSKAEGVSKYDESDFDMLDISSITKATECEDLVPDDNDQTLFMENCRAPPGYCKLQLLQSSWDNMDHLCYVMYNCYVSCPDYCRPHLSSGAVVHMENMLMFYKCKKSGPANTGQDPSGRKTDNVRAIRCAHMPLSFKNWIKSHQGHAWPTKQLMEKIARSDIYLVPVGMHDTEERDLQWRVSFNIPEKILIQNFTNVQHKIYVLLKMIKTEIIEPQCPDSITSYIVKTLMLWAVEQIPEQVWTDRKLTDLLFYVLQILYRCINHGYCPMYFIPECNILHGRVTKSTRKVICDILSSLLSDRISCILRLPSILTKLYQYIFVPMPFRAFQQATEKTNIAIFVVRKVNSICLRITERPNCRNSITEIILPRVTYEDSLTDLMSILAPAGSERKKLFKYVFSQTLSQLAIQQCADAFTHNASNIHNYRRIRQCMKILNGTCATNVLCGRVRLAQVLCMLGQYTAAQGVLESGTNRIRSYMQNSTVRIRIPSFVHHSRLNNVCENTCFSTSQLLRNFSLSEVLYDKEMKLCLPIALRYEASRRLFYVAPMPCYIDSEPMLYLLQYVCNLQLRQKSSANVALTKLTRCAIRRDSNIEYREVALNVLGHCLMKEGLYDKACRVLVKSVMFVNKYQYLGQMYCMANNLTPDIALWHIAILLYKVHRNSQ